MGCFHPESLRTRVPKGEGRPKHRLTGRGATGGAAVQSRFSPESAGARGHCPRGEIDPARRCQPGLDGRRAVWGQIAALGVADVRARTPRDPRDRYLVVTELSPTGVEPRGSRPLASDRRPVRRGDRPLGSGTIAD